MRQVRQAIYRGVNPTIHAECITIYLILNDYRLISMISDRVRYHRQFQGRFVYP